jgi:hypothetical protein
VPSSHFSKKGPPPVELPLRTEAVAPLVYVGQLLDLMAQDLQSPRLSSAWEVCCQLIGATDAAEVRQTRIDLVFQFRSRIGHLLENDGYSNDEVREIQGQVAYGMEYATAAGWQPYQHLPEAWKAIPDLNDARKCMASVLYFVEAGLDPKDVTLDHILRWFHTQVAKEILPFQIAQRIAHALMHLLEELGLLNVDQEVADPALPPSPPFEKLPLKLQTQVNTVLESKRPAEEGTPRSSRRTWSPATAAGLRKSVCAIYGFLIRRLTEGDQGVQAVERVQGIEQVFREKVFRAFRLELEKRKCLPGTIRQMFALPISVARSHPLFPKEHFGWLDAFQKEMPTESQEDIRRRKDGRYLVTADFLGIPAKIHEDRLSSEQRWPGPDRAGSGHPRIGFRRARLAMFELIMLIIVRLAWPPRLIYRCRIGGQNPNIFFGKIDPDSKIEIDSWFQAEHARNPDAKCWQYRFGRSETGRGIKQGMWPFHLIQPLKEFEEFRKTLVRDKATDTLFTNCFGGPLTERTLRDILLFITIKYAFKALPPQLCRENFAEAYSHDRPWDILGLAVILGIGPALAEKLFGQPLNPSWSTPAVEAWHAERHAEEASKESGAPSPEAQAAYRPLPPRPAMDPNLASRLEDAAARPGKSAPRNAVAAQDLARGFPAIKASRDTQQLNRGEAGLG